MKRRFFLYFFSAALLTFTFWACRQDRFRSGDDGSGPTLTVEEARAFFESRAVLSKAREWLSPPDGEPRGFSPGDFTPLWDEAKGAVLDYQLEGFDVPIRPTIFYTVRFHSVNHRGDSVSHLVEATQKLVVNRWSNHPRWEGLYGYIATIIPTPGYYARNKDFSRKFINLGNKSKFSGFVIYHTLEGRFVNLDRYEEGKMTRQLYEGTGSVLTAEDIHAVMGDVTLYGGTPGAYAASIESPEVEVRTCRECKARLDLGETCKCCKPHRKFNCPICGQNNDNNKKDEEDDKKDPPGGPKDDDDDDKNKHKEKPPFKFNDEDCTEQASKNIKSTAEKFSQISKLPTFRELLSKSEKSAVEHSTSFYRQNGEIKSRGILDGSATLVDIETVPGLTIATAHTHLKDIPPSAQDIMANIEITDKSPECSEHYIITQGSPRVVYTVYIEDPELARIFLELYPKDSYIENQHFKEGTVLEKAFTDAYGRLYEGFSPAERQAYAMAHVLEKFFTGIKLIRSELPEEKGQESIENNFQMGLQLHDTHTNVQKCQ